MRTFALFGDPVSHSISPRLHNKAIRDLGLNGFYSRIHLQDGNELINKFRSLKLNGANVTIPHKAHALNLADIASNEALAIGSANTLVLKDDKIHAYNTDAPGFIRAVSSFGKLKSALIIGAGGTAKALAYALSKNCINVEILNRSSGRFDDFNDYECFSWQNFKPRSYDIVINSTSAGLKDDALPAPIEILRSCFKNSKFAFDVIYNIKTPFLTLAKEFGLSTKDGADMLLFQAVFALNLFYDKSLNENDIEISMREAMLLSKT